MQAGDNAATMPVSLVCVQSRLAVGELMVPSIYRDIKAANQTHPALRLPPHSLI